VNFLALDLNIFVIISNQVLEHVSGVSLRHAIFGSGNFDSLGI
jgi:hypothetical protein